MLYPIELQAHSKSQRLALYWSGQRDSNPRPPAPKAGALPDCAMPRADLPYRWSSEGRCIIRSAPNRVKYQRVLWDRLSGLRRLARLARAAHHRALRFNAKDLVHG